MRPLLEMKALLAGQPTLSALIRASSRLIGFHTQGAVMTCEERGAQVLWTYRLDESVRAGRCHGNQLALSMMMALLRAALGRRWLPDAVLIEQERPVRVDAFEEMLGPRLAFDMPLSGILFPKRLLAHPLPRVGPDGFGEVACLQKAFLDAAPGDDLVAAVRQLIAASLGDGGPRIGQIADACGLSARTLQRQLSAGGAGFSGLVDAVRRAEAEVRLRTTDEPLLSIALDLGYSDASNFTHAFRRWAGFTPSAYRRGCAVPKSTA
jgi:AraC-like DNA-binding protein